ncbi:UNKNOWN [Stylonychia lemnae]|uniref:Uncharacterized protein n=1 Tax=Stylonychia lemnae TaxID=5949 RepID=A0A078AD17_STYLE|nr:UNKNOWN [Stylonychia lemnae]|eukprot:CDW80119.1 UNKNOWN [Stylonychia lemnae]
MEQQQVDLRKNIEGNITLLQVNDKNGILSFEFQMPSKQYREHQEARVKNSHLIVVLDASQDMDQAQFQVIKEKLKVFLKFYQKENPDKPNPHLLICNDEMTIVRDQYEVALDKTQLKSNLNILIPLRYIQEESNKIANRELNLVFILQSLNYLDDKTKALIEKISINNKNNFKYCTVSLLIISDDCSDESNLDILQMGTHQGKFIVVTDIISKLYHDDIVYKDLFYQKLNKFMLEALYNTRVKNGFLIRFGLIQVYLDYIVEGIECYKCLKKGVAISCKDLDFVQGDDIIQKLKNTLNNFSKPFKSISCILKGTVAHDLSSIYIDIFEMNSFKSPQRIEQNISQIIRQLQQKANQNESAYLKYW